MATVPSNTTVAPGTEGQIGLRSALEALVRRTKLAVWVRHLSRFTIIASAANLVLALVTGRVFGPIFPIAPAILAIYAIAVVASVVASSRSRVSSLAVARYADERLGLKQRLSSALALGDEAQRGVDPTFLRLQTADAAAAAGLLKPEQTVPLRGVRREAAGALVSVIVVIALILLMHRGAPAMLQGAPDRVVEQEGAQLTRSAQQIARDATAQSLPKTGQYAKQMAQIGKQMQSRSLTRAQATSRLASLSTAVRNEQQALAQQSAAPNSSQARSAGGAPQTSQSGPAGKGAGVNSQGKVATAARAEGLNHALNQAAKQAGATGPSPSEQKQAAQELQSLAKEASQAGLSQTARDLNAASQALAQGRTNEAAADLKRALADAKREEQAAERSASGASSNAGSSQKQAASSQPANGQKATQTGQSGQGNQASQDRQSGQQGTGEAKSGQQGAGGQAQQAGASNNAAGQQAAASKDAQGLQAVERSLNQAEQQLAGQQNGAGSGPSNNGQAGQGSGQSRQQAGSGKRGMPGGNNTAAERGGQSQSAGGAPSNITQGEGRGGPTAPGQYTPAKISGVGYSTPKSSAGIFQGKPRQIDNYKPQSAGSYARMYLPASATGRTISQKAPGAGHGPGAGAQVSSVPYYQVYPQFKKGAEAAIAKEDIPRPYANKVRQYFQSLAPSQTAKGPR